LSEGHPLLDLRNRKPLIDRFFHRLQEVKFYEGLLFGILLLWLLDRRV
jgi:hypothetical protein